MFTCMYTDVQLLCGKIMNKLLLPNSRDETRKAYLLNRLCSINKNIEVQ